MLARTRKKAVRGIVEPRLRPSTIALAFLSAVLGGMILYNIFLGQDEYAAARLVSGATQMTVSAPGKGSRSIVLKYDVLVEDIQRELLATGHFLGLVDGVDGPRTKAAIRSYQRANGLAVTGAVSMKLLDHIRYTRKLSQAADFTGSIAAPSANAPEVPPPAAGHSQSAVEELAPAPAALPGKDDAVLELQTRLAGLGYDPGSRSGVLDEGTKSAILIFEMDRGLAMRGEINAALLSAVAEAERQQAAQ